MDFLNSKWAGYLLTNVSLRKGWRNLGKLGEVRFLDVQEAPLPTITAFTLTKATVVLPSFFTLHQGTKGAPNAYSKLTCELRAKFGTWRRDILK